MPENGDNLIIGLRHYLKLLWWTYFLEIAYENFSPEYFRFFPSTM